MWKEKRKKYRRDKVFFRLIHNIYSSSVDTVSGEIGVRSGIGQHGLKNFFSVGKNDFLPKFPPWFKLYLALIHT